MCLYHILYSCTFQCSTMYILHCNTALALPWHYSFGTYYNASTHHAETIATCIIFSRVLPIPCHNHECSLGVVNLVSHSWWWSSLYVGQRYSVTTSTTPFRTPIHCHTWIIATDLLQSFVHPQTSPRFMLYHMQWEANCVPNNYLKTSPRTYKYHLRFVWFFMLSQRFHPVWRGSYSSSWLIN